jgi:hypothetical protein
MWNPYYVEDFVKKFLPYSSEIIMIGKPYDKPAIIMADIDGDNKDEILVAYKVSEKPYFSVLKCSNNNCYLADTIKGEGYNVTYFDVRSITDDKNRDIVVGWQQGAIWSKLEIYRLKDDKLKKINNEEYIFSKIEIVDIPTKCGEKGSEEVVLWVHDTGLAYNVEIYRWNGYELVPAPEVYPYYFPKVIRYYEKLVSEYPDAIFYWYYLADAQFKAGKTKEALVTVNKALSLNQGQYYEQKLLELKKEILQNLNLGEKYLHPASIRTINGTKWGYIDDKGDFVIDPIFEYVMNFQANDLAVVQLNSLQGIINKEGSFIVKPKYENINEFSEGRAPVLNKEGFKIIDEWGKEIIDKYYDYIGSFRSGRAVTSNRVGDMYYYGYLDREGKEIIPIKYKNAYDFKNGKAIVEIEDNKFALINTLGEILNTYEYSFVGPLGDNELLAFSKESEGKKGYINIAGNIIIEPRFTIALPFERGRAVVNITEDYSNKYGLIDTQGNFVIPPEYNDINIIGEERAAVGEAIDEDKPYLGSKYAISDINGNFLTGFIYSNVTSYNEGFASASEVERTFFIDRSGKEAKDLPKIKGQGTLTMEGNLIRANVDMRTFYLDKYGKVVWRQNICVELNDKYKVFEEKFKPNKDYIVYYPQIYGMKDISLQKAINYKLKELSKIKNIPSDVQLDYSYTGDFSIEFFKKQLLVLELDGYEYYFGAAHGMPTKVYPHIDLVSGRFYSLKDLFKKDSDYVKVLSDIIEEQIKNNEEYSYVFPDSYKGIRADQPFYVNEKALYIYFDPYEIAPYAAGFPTFKIPFLDIANIIDDKGDFWNSFNY